MEAVGQLAGGVAHDFNNLLTVISGFSELMLCSCNLNDMSQEFVKEILRAAERAASLTRQLLAFSRKQMLQPQVMDLNSLVAEAQKMLRRLIGEDVNLDASLDPDLGWIKADPGQIEQVLLNLVVNARDAMPRGGHLTIETHNVDLDEEYVRHHVETQVGRYILLAITDTGKGMNEAIKARIFEPFFTTKEVGKGTGLGLSTVFGIIKQSGGHIEVYSEEGRGTTFKIYLPRVPRGSSTSIGSVQSPIPKGTETILVAEDEEGVRSLVRLALVSYGYNVLESQHGEEALEVFRNYSDRIHLLMTDVVMPRMSGRQLANHITVLQPDIKVLFLSGYTDDAVVRHGMVEAGVPFLQKPFTPTMVARKVREVLDN
jgi:two-component system cell cycle sensor histidine kinase/response regulator CckA